jgi:hypothetical protein
MEPALRSSAKPASLPAFLNQRLNTYVVAATAAGVSALAMAQGAEAQIVFTPANKTINTGQRMLIDLNHDGVPDVVIREGQCSASVYFPGNSLQAVPQAGGGVERIYPGLAAALSDGSEIGGRKFFNSRAGVMATFSNYGVYYFGSWVDYESQAKYLGIKFSSAGEIHYGWARLTVLPANKDIFATLSGYAYETRANTPIRAGDRGTQGDEASSEVIEGTEPAERFPRTLGHLARGAPALPLPLCGRTQ